MGHRLSKTPRPLDSRHAPHEGSPTEPRPVLNLQLEDAPGQSPEPQPAPVASSACPRQIIIKIQLAKMEPGHDAPPAGDGAASPVNSSGSSNNNHSNSYNNGSSSSNNNNNNGTQFVNLTFDRSLACGEAAPPASEAPPSHNNNDGGNNNNNNFHVLMGPMAELQLDEKRLSLASVSSSGSGSGSSSGADPGPEEAAVAAASSTSARRRTESPPSGEGEHCCRRKAKSSPFPARWRCCKCTCRDAFKRILDASSARGARRKERKEAAPQPQTPALVAAPPAASAPPTTNPAVSMSMWAPSASDVIIPISAPQFVVLQCPPSSLVTVGRIDDHAIRLTATELVPGGAAPRVLAPPPAPAPTATTTPAPAPTSTPAPPVEATPGSSSGGSPGAATPHGPGGGPSAGPVVHSQVDYIHCLVPDLEKITKASFYWGKMDRYEAERLLEGKPEGTFLLRDSAQEEYLFSVTFRKYGRSLHARIEQSNHKFSFDCHDPCVFTAPTVTGLLEHYKDPACVMFFEPMLTIPLHRSTTFSLQQLCRATIVSHTTYDGVTELELPARLKAYLKEYHYKQKLRVKPFDEPFYSCT